MIQLTRLDGLPLVLNAELIEHIESVPETVIVLTTNKRLMVRETVDEVVARVLAYRQAVYGCGRVLHSPPEAASDEAERT